MEIIESLTRKVQQAARELNDLKQERLQLMSELELLRGQIQKHQALARENEKFKRDQDLVRNRLLRLQKKIDKHLLVETTIAAQSNGGINEEHPQ